MIIGAAAKAVKTGFNKGFIGLMSSANPIKPAKRIVEINAK